jgi:hypothetical protein
MGDCCPKDSIISSGMVAGISGVHTGPGATEFTRMPFSTRFWPSALVKLTIAPLEAA